MQLYSKSLDGIVVALKANYLIVEINIESRKERFLCTKRNRLSYEGSSVYVGDLVLIDHIDVKYHTAVITKVMNRNSYLNRPPIANISDVFVVTSLLDPVFDKNQTIRFLLSAEQTRQRVSVIITKSDLVTRSILEEYLNRFKEWGYETFAISVISREGIDTLFNKLKLAKLAVLIGPSGVGKSSLLNNLIPNLDIPVGTLSKKLRKGKHTTRHVELFYLDSGVWIADTPGYNKPDFNFEIYEIDQLFPELRSQLQIRNCKFRNCLHIDEPGCVISRDWDRYETYKACLEESFNLRR